MPIQRGDFVRPNTNRSLPKDSVGRVICSAGALKLEPENIIMHQKQDSLSRRLGPVFAEKAAQKVAQMAEQMVSQAANAQQGPKSGQQGVENPNPMPAPSKAYKPAPGGYPA